MGEFTAVLNGVEFRTRHNDYKLVKPQTIPTDGNSTTIPYNKVEDIVFPDVPPSVLAKGTIKEQIEEMREYFRAFKEQNSTRREYKKYFKPILCYLEGGWTQSGSGEIDESFDSDRHHLDASSWLDLQEKVRYSSYTGRKDRFENFAYLPTTIMKVVDNIPMLAQWNYRIVCHPLKDDLPTNRLRLIDDIEVRLAYKQNIDQYESSRSARYKVAPRNTTTWKDGVYRYDFLDSLMGEIPGKDGYGANIVDDGISGSRAKDFTDPTKDLNAAYYHRWFTGDRDAMGSKWQHRGYADDSLFVAATTQAKIAPLEVKYCRKKVCRSANQRFTYAIPLEIVYMNPLQQWNPYGIDYKPYVSPKVDGKDGKSEKKAFEHVDRNTYDRTPFEFFKNNKYTGDAADTSNGFLWVKGKDGVAKKVVASGLRVKLPQIEGIASSIRLRYPIMPIHQEGSVTWKRLEALEEYARAYPEAKCKIDNEC